MFRLLSAPESGFQMAPGVAYAPEFREPRAQNISRALERLKLYCHLQPH